MSARAIREFDGKRLLAAHFKQYCTQSKPLNFATPTPAQVKIDVLPTDQAKLHKELHDSFTKLETENPWLLQQSLVVKVDQLLKRRGKSGLLLLGATWAQTKKWILDHAGKQITTDGVRGCLKTFLVEPFVAHSSDCEYYVCLQSKRNCDEIMFYSQGGIDVGDVDSKASRLVVPVDEFPSLEQVSALILSSGKIDSTTVQTLAHFIVALFHFYVDLHFTYFEVNPLVVIKQTQTVHCLDMAAKLDQTAEFECTKKWIISGRSIEFPAPFGRELTPEESYVAELDAKTGASLKLTVLNKDGRIWTMVAGGGASVVYSDAIASHGFADELANYGEYSGAPSEAQTYEYSKTIIDLMTRGDPHPAGKILFIGGGIANFTNVASTFKGIIRTLKEYQRQLIVHRVKIYVRRGGPNYEEGLKLMRELGDFLGVPIFVFGPETHITAIVPIALKDQLVPQQLKKSTGATSTVEQYFTPVTNNSSVSNLRASDVYDDFESAEPSPIKYFHSETLTTKPLYELFNNESRSFVYGMQPKAVQGMLDFDHLSKRKKPSVAAMIYSFGGEHVQKFYWGTQETLLTVFTGVEAACKNHPDVDVVINFASHRSVLESCREILACPQIRTIAIVAEGVPERHTKRLNLLASKRGVTIIGPATVGGLRAGAFKIGNTGGMIDNVLSSRLYRPGSVCYVSKSGGMSNELNNIISRYSNGVLEGIAIGGDRYPGTTFIDHIERFESDPLCKIIVMLGEVGGTEEYRVAEAVKAGKIKKPVIAWCIGICAKMFGTEVQFGHAGACAGSDVETATAKNQALKESGVNVPNCFEDLPATIQSVYDSLVASKTILPSPEPETPKLPIDFEWAQELGLIRKPAHFVSTICDDRGQELLYAGMPISSVFKENIGIGGVISLLWFRRRLPEWACQFIEMVLMLTADHGPAVSGAHNTIVAARAGKDLVSSVTSGLLTIGERFGGALDGAAEQFSTAYDQGLTAADFVETMRKQHKLILGIGHRVKSRTNPDLRVSLLIDYAHKNFPTTPLLDYALLVEGITTQKKDNLILNVDGAVATIFVDLLRHSGAFTREEADEYISIGTLNGLFVLGRSIGFIGHFLDQKRLKQGLYRHPWDDITYFMPNSI